MSGTSGSVRSCAGSMRLGAAPAGHEVVLDALYDRKRDTKTVRVLTVIIYVICVSLAAIMLSLYYVFFWKPKDAQLKVSHSVEKQSTTPMPICLMPHTGGSNTSVTKEIYQAGATATMSQHTNAEEVHVFSSNVTDIPSILSDTSQSNTSLFDITTLNETDSIT